MPRRTSAASPYRTVRCNTARRRRLCILAAGTVTRCILERAMTLHLSLAPLLALIAGILILIRPKLLNFIVAIYLIVIGVLGLFPGLGSVF
jgi:hypothetical protein